VVEVVGVVFSSGVKVYHFDPAGLELSEGDQVVVQTSSGPEIGEVVEPIHEVEDSEIAAALKKVQRVATSEDLQARVDSEDLRRRAMIKCRELIQTHGLDMKLVGAEVGFGGEKVSFSFSAEERVDFRALVSDLSKALGLRVELRQVGAREEARMVGGLGPCGRGLCCATFGGDDDPVSIRMAKEQNLPLNPAKISGLCGRLMCCLKYEQEQYVKFRKEGPAKGTRVIMPDGEGVVCGYSFTKEAVCVRPEEGPVVDVCLCACEQQKDGSLLVVEQEPPAPLAPWLDTPGGMGLSVAGSAGARVSAEDEVEPASAGKGKSGVADGSGSSRSRKSRNRRRSRSRAKAQGQGTGGEAGGKQNAQPGAKSPASPQTDGAQSRSAGRNEGGGSGGSGSSSRSRRRRRPRRKSGGASGGQGGGSQSRATNGGSGGPANSG